MASNVIAYAGNNSFDIILYLSRILQRLGRKVLIADYNDSMALTCSIPAISGIDAYMDFSCYMNVDFTKKAVDETIIAGYDDVLIDCGLGKPAFNTNLITKLVFVSDMFEFNLMRLSQIPFYDRLTVKKELLIRQVADIDISSEQMAAIVNKDISKVVLLYYDEADYQNALLCNYNKIASFSGISDRLRKYLLDELAQLVENASARRLKAAFYKARKAHKSEVIEYEHSTVLVTLPWAGANK
ncbi:MAG: hypothetical protein GX757_06320 [Clostridiales bacterium]|nr:hypothetical protein [Clostridiales bacterium]